MASALLSALPALASAGSGIVGGVIEQIGSGIRESQQHKYKTEELAQLSELEKQQLELKEQLTEKEAQKLLDLELKKMNLETDIYKSKSLTDVEKYKQLAELERQQQQQKTEDELKLIQAKYGGQSDLLKLQMNMQTMQQQQQYEPTRLSDYNIYSSVGAYAPLSSPLPQFSQQAYVPFKRIPSYKAGLTGHKIMNY